MSLLPKSVEKVIEEFRKLPGVGKKTATRLAYHYIRSSKHDATALANALLEMDSNIRLCKHCFNVSEEEVCQICKSPLRDKSKLCIVQEAMDVMAMEDVHVYNGLYFVLGGVISPADGITAEELRFDALKNRIATLIKNSKHDKSQTNHEDSKIEIIIALSPSLEGEATTMYIKSTLKKFLDDEQIVISRIAVGLPTGADVEYADSLTLRRSLEERRVVAE